MHMADALLSPAVGGAMWGASASAIAFASARLKRQRDERKAPAMGVLGAFVFAAQMINFSIPGTGSSGHLGGGLLLAILLGPEAAFLSIASVLVVQALFFADGGLLALGCNIFNVGFFPCFVIFPLLYRRLAGSGTGKARRTLAIVLCAVGGLQLGSLAVVVETALSGVSSLPFRSFLLLMQPIHLAIGLVEGAATVGIVSFVAKAHPEMLQPATPAQENGRRWLLPVFLVAAFVAAAGLSGYASKAPDGLEWAIARVTGKTQAAAPDRGLHRTLARIQEKTSMFPDYQLKPGSRGETPAATDRGEEASDATRVAGSVGALIALVVAFTFGFLLRKGRKES